MEGEGCRLSTVLVVFILQVTREQVRQDKQPIQYELISTSPQRFASLFFFRVLVHIGVYHFRISSIHIFI